MTPVVIPPDAARRLFLGAQGLLGTPPKADPSTVLAMVQKVGFVQLDAIQVAGRAHDLTLRTRLEGYEPNHLEALLEEDRTLFEGWTHDASAIPTQWHAHWKPRYRRDGPRIEASAWWRNLLGDDHERVCKHVLARIRKEGPLGSADFEHPEKRGPWWGWKPQKA
ncbi:MAG: winged helix DNA-binding domain-containing protein, partial [Firmicutes bacterium]|nr:winged helix DNA-binding domain-containing protein [Bacillota bacterium]